MTLDEWLEIGITNKWCGPAICHTHDGLPTSEAEDIEFEEDDPCIHIIRLYESAEQALSIEENHSPSVWRKNG
jgi:hypothetical protein